jgi:hypothetical protein
VWELARRRYVPENIPEVKPAASTPDEKTEGAGSDVAVGKKGFQAGAKNPKYASGAMSSEVELSAEAFAAMKQQEELYYTEIDKLATERKWDMLKVLQIKTQAARVVRVNAILKSNYGRMKAEPKYRRRVQEPTTSESVIRYEAQAQKQEALLYQMMGMDEMHEAKLGAVETKNKPTELQVLVGGNLNKRHMAAADGGDE